jgi:cell division protein FtsZ
VADIIFGSTFDDSLEGKIRVSVVATGMDREAKVAPVPTFLSVTSPVAHRQEAEARPKAEIPEPVKATVADSVEDPVIADLTELATVAAPNALVTQEVDLEIPSAELVHEVLKTGAAQEAEAKEVEIEEVVPVIKAEAGIMVEVETEQISEIVVEQGEPAPATPGQNTEDAFIPEAPVSSTGKQAPEVADPFAAAAMTNGSKRADSIPEASEPKAKKQSLFERVTGLAGSTGDVAETITFEPKAAVPPLASLPGPASASAEAEEKNKLGGLDEAERISSPQEEADLLDIPAFLRRQAN